MSVMHYDNNAFTNGNGSTIITKDPKFEDVIGQRMEMSYYDVQELNNLYKCSKCFKIVSKPHLVNYLVNYLFWWFISISKIIWKLHLFCCSTVTHKGPNICKKKWPPCFNRNTWIVIFCVSFKVWISYQQLHCIYSFSRVALFVSTSSELLKKEAIKH